LQFNYRETVRRYRVGSKNNSLNSLVGTRSQRFCSHTRTRIVRARNPSGSTSDFSHFFPPDRIPSRNFSQYTRLPLAPRPGKSRLIAGRTKVQARGHRSNHNHNSNNIAGDGAVRSRRPTGSAMATLDIGTTLVDVTRFLRGSVYVSTRRLSIFYNNDGITAVLPRYDNNITCIFFTIITSYAVLVDSDGRVVDSFFPCPRRSGGGRYTRAYK